ncbi:sensor histidine kinase [Anthocerotibacter panamensis]|uniref:sensor histidine kinase n=1 Tax=Anthocerotibacter panamensis TaxID=2857077 RepID=UPI001C401488|nr:HAMP domain-containing sensor histidine kinase [Anthocerotibacter panamensis]
MFSNVRQRLLLNNLLVLESILLVFCVAVYVFFSHILYAQMDERLMLLARAVAAYGEDEISEVSANRPIPLKEAEEQIVPGRGARIQWLDVRGQVLASQGSLELGPFPLQTGTFYTQVHPERARVYSLASREPTGRARYVQVALALAPYDQQVNRLLAGLAGALVLTLGSGALAGVWLTRQAMRPIEAGYARLRQFTADASHELRSPLTVIKTNCAVARTHQAQLTSQEMHDTLTGIEDATDSMAQLVKDLLLLARADDPGTVLSASRYPVDLEDLVGEVIEDLSPVAQQRNVQLAYRVRAHPIVLAEPQALVRLFRNLIENALQYTAPAGQVTVVLEEAQQALLMVQDTGIGIAPEHLKHVFDRFWRADRARSQRTGGTGLGLAIARTIAQAHGGDITVTSTLNTGSTFAVHLPIHHGAEST